MTKTTSQQGCEVYRDHYVQQRKGVYAPWPDAQKHLQKQVVYEAIEEASICF